MIKIRQMTPEDFLIIMKMNAHIYRDFDELSYEHKKYIANLNIITGEAQSFFEDGKLVGVGGIKYIGIGEGWLITPPEIREQNGLSLFKETHKFFIKTRDDKNLWRVFAETSISENFLKRLDFKPHPHGLVWTRT